VKNPGNIVPPSSVAIGPNSTAAAVEFAVAGLEVSDIVVCGHTQCGAMDALLTGLSAPAATPHLAGWLELAAPVRNLVQGPYANFVPPEARAIVAADENVLLAIENLRTYPIVRERIEQGKLRLHAWMFKIANAELFAYDAARQEFRPIVAAP
jgi:carbonic anhydrase